jgi:hypothetical protein
MNRYQMNFGSAKNEDFARYSYLHLDGDRTRTPVAETNGINYRWRSLSVKRIVKIAYFLAWQVFGKSKSTHLFVIDDKALEMV